MNKRKLTKMPKVILLKLTRAQVAALDKHFRWVDQEWEAGRKGILAGQFHHRKDYAFGQNIQHKDIVRIGFLAHKKATALQEMPNE